MKENLRRKGLHALLAWLLCAGILMPALGVLFRGFSSWTPLLWAGAVILLLEAASFRRSWAVGAGIALPLLILLWVFALGGYQRLSDVLIAVSLRLRGLHSALPLVRAHAVLLLSLAAGLIAWLAVFPGASYLPSLVLCTGTMLLLWLSDSPELIPWLIPALIPLQLLLVADRHEQTPLWRVLPWAALLVALAFVLAPRADGFVVEPLREKAEEMRKAIVDRLFFTEPRDVFSLSSEGYYPEGTSQLGGKPEINEHSVMQVSAPRSVYLRGVILNEYDGHTWRNTTGGRRYLWQSPQMTSERARLFDMNLPAVSSGNALLTAYPVSVRMLDDSSSTLFVPQRIRELTPGGDLVPYFSNSSEVFITRNLQAGDTYEVLAPLFRAGDPGIGTLVTAASAFSDDSWADVVSLYTALPSHLEKPVYDLAAEITAGLNSPYEKAFALQSWLSRNCRYTLDVQDHPVNVDFVTRFLLETREGYCTYFASALTVLCRMAGLPARYVEGYLAEPNAAGEALVTGLNAHAWTEVCFEGFGWLTFDATPRRTTEELPGENAFKNGPDPSPSPDTPADGETVPEMPVEAEEQPASPQPQEQETDSSGSPENDPPPAPSAASSFPFWVLLLLPAALTLRGILTSPVLRAKKASAEEARLEIWFVELTAVLAAAGFTRNPGETLISFTRRVDCTGRFSETLGTVGECVSLVRYSTASCTPGDTALLEAAARALRKELDPPAKLKYWLRRLFMPSSRRTQA